MDITAIIADGVVDAAEVAAIRSEIYADGKIEKSEVEDLFKINDAVSGAANDPGWAQLLADAVCDCVLADDVTPGVVSKEEALWLTDLLMADGGVDETEKAVLVQLKAKATSIDPDFATALNSLGI